MLRRLHASAAGIDDVNGEVGCIRLVNDPVDDQLFVVAERAQLLIGRFVVHGERGVVLHAAREKDHELLSFVSRVGAGHLDHGARGALQRLQRPERLFAGSEADHFPVIVRVGLKVHTLSRPVRKNGTVHLMMAEEGRHVFHLLDRRADERLLSRERLNDGQRVSDRRHRPFGLAAEGRVELLLQRRERRIPLEVLDEVVVDDQDDAPAGRVSNGVLSRRRCGQSRFRADVRGLVDREVRDRHQLAVLEDLEIAARQVHDRLAAPIGDRHVDVDDVDVDVRRQRRQRTVVLCGDGWDDDEG
jgi:hypothetical protein